MKSFMYVVFLCAAAHATLKASDTLPAIGDAFQGIIRSKEIIEDVELRNRKELISLLMKARLMLEHGADSDVEAGFDIQVALLEIDNKIQEIGGKSTQLGMIIKAAAEIIKAMSINDKRTDYIEKRDFVIKVCNESLIMTKNILGLIDEAKISLGTKVGNSLYQLKLSVQTKSNQDIREKQYEVQQIEQFRDAWWMIFYPGKRQEANEVIEIIRQAIREIENLISDLATYMKWLEDKCEEVKKQLEKNQIDIAKVEGKVKNTENSGKSISDVYDEMLFDKTITDSELAEASRILVDLMGQLSKEVSDVMLKDCARISDKESFVMICRSAL